MSKRTLIEIALGIVALFVIMALINQMYPRDKRELIPNSAFDFVLTDYAEEYVNNITELMKDVHVLELLEVEGVTSITRNTEKRQEKLNAYENDIDSFINGYKSNDGQESNALFNKLIELGEVGKKAIVEMRVIYNTHASDEDRIQSASRLRNIYTSEFIPLDKEIGDYVNTLTNKYEFEK